jgi:hypothetical protein
MLEPVTVLVADPESGVAVPHGYESSLRQIRSIEAARDAKRLFVVSSATMLPSVAGCISLAAKHHRLHGLFVHNDMGRDWVNQIYERAALRRIRNSVVHSNPAVGRRILKAIALRAQDHFIADATVANDQIFVMDCGFRIHELSFDAYPSLRQIPRERRDDYDIVLDGAYLHWDDYDVDLDLESIRLAADPDLRAAVGRKRILHDQAFGAGVRILREEHGLRQSDIAGLSERQLRRIEKGAAVTGDAINTLAEAHGMDPDNYLNEVAERIPA